MFARIRAHHRDAGSYQKMCLRISLFFFAVAVAASYWLYLYL